MSLHYPGLQNLIRLECEKGSSLSAVDGWKLSTV